jgi:hypothetical protein
MTNSVHTQLIFWPAAVRSVLSIDYLSMYVSMALSDTAPFERYWNNFTRTALVHYVKSETGSDWLGTLQYKRFPEEVLFLQTMHSLVKNCFNVAYSNNSSNVCTDVMKKPMTQIFACLCAKCSSKHPPFYCSANAEDKFWNIIYSVTTGTKTLHQIQLFFPVPHSENRARVSFIH